MRSRRPAVFVAAGLLVAAAGTAGLLLTRHGTPALRPVALGVDTVPAPTGPIAFPSPTGPIVAALPSAQSRPVSRPVSLTIPLIGVQTNLMYLGLNSHGQLQVPPLSMVAVAGWYTGSPRPGAIGSAIIVGHIDGNNQRGVFFRLRTLRRGDRIYVRRADGTLVEFRVTSVQTYLKKHFPTEDVFGPVPDAELRLITCGGAYDYATRHYLSNIVVYAVEVG